MEYTVKQADREWERDRETTEQMRASAMSKKVMQLERVMRGHHHDERFHDKVTFGLKQRNQPE